MIHGHLPKRTCCHQSHKLQSAQSVKDRLALFGESIQVVAYYRTTLVSDHMPPLINKAPHSSEGNTWDQRDANHQVHNYAGDG